MLNIICTFALAQFLVILITINYIIATECEGIKQLILNIAVNVPVFIMAIMINGGII